MTITPLNNLSEFKAMIEDNRVVVVHFWAPLDGPCQEILPVYEQLAKQYSDSKVKFCKVDVVSAPDVKRAAGILEVPAFQL
ncbi:hypothetical protein V8E36_000898 [Tilletia maclaganii]